MAEGRFVVERLLGDSRFRPDSLFLTSRACESLRPVLSQLSQPVPVYVAKQAVFNEVVGFDMHRGCLAAGRIGEATRADEIIAASRDGASLVVVLEGLTNTENIGNVFRNALAFGVAGVLLCPRCCDPLYRKSIRVSMGSTLTVPFARCEAWPECLASLRTAGYRLLGLDLAEDAVSPSEVSKSIDLGDRIALILGTEGKGLCRETLEYVDDSVRIPMMPGVDSLNVATASGIVLQLLFAKLHRPVSPSGVAG